jgi:hypothetical protein
LSIQLFGLSSHSLSSTSAAGKKQPPAMTGGSGSAQRFGRRMQLVPLSPEDQARFRQHPHDFNVVYDDHYTSCKRPIQLVFSPKWPKRDAFINAVPRVRHLVNKLTREGWEDLARAVAWCHEFLLPTLSPPVRDQCLGWLGSEYFISAVLRHRVQGNNYKPKEYRPRAKKVKQEEDKKPKHEGDTGTAAQRVPERAAVASSDAAADIIIPAASEFQLPVFDAAGARGPVLADNKFVDPIPALAPALCVFNSGSFPNAISAWPAAAHR